MKTGLKAFAATSVFAIVLFAIVITPTSYAWRHRNTNTFVWALCNNGVTDTRTFQSTDLADHDIDIMSDRLGTELCRTNGGIFHRYERRTW